MWAYASAVMLGMSETAASRGDPRAIETLARLDREEEMLKGTKESTSEKQEEDFPDDVTDDTLDSVGTPERGEL